MSTQVINNIMQFMQRVQLGGKEVNAFNEAMHWLQGAATKLPTPIEEAIEADKKKDLDPNEIFRSKSKTKKLLIKSDNDTNK